MIKVSRSIVPNFFTVGNMFCGFMSVIMATINGDLVMASWMIFFAAFLDAMDGKIARFTKSASEFGIEYDSLADVISFGLAPAVLVYSFYFAEWRQVGIFISFFPLLFGSVRLARFNVQTTVSEKSHFVGLPSPMAAVAIAGFILFTDEVFAGKVFPKLLLVLMLVVCVLMVSTVRYEIIPRLTFRGAWATRMSSLGLITAIISVIIYPKILFFPYTVLYILSGLVITLIRRGMDLGDGMQEVAGDEPE